MSQLESLSKKIKLNVIKHAWQPEWVESKEDVDTFFKLLDQYSYLGQESKNWYPPFIVFIDDSSGRELLSFLHSSWSGTYDPQLIGKPSPIKIMRENGVEV